jgi:hypothetical protein
MKSMVAMILSAAVVAAGAVMHYLVQVDPRVDASSKTGSILMIAGVITLALSNVCFLTTRNRRGVVNEALPTQRPETSPVRPS